MNWFETLLHIAPDHGDGSAEALCCLLAAAAFTILMRARRHSAR